MKLDEMLGEDGLTYLVNLADAAGRAIMAIYTGNQSQQVALKPDWAMASSLSTLH